MLTLLDTNLCLGAECAKDRAHRHLHPCPNTHTDVEFGLVRCHSAGQFFRVTNPLLPILWGDHLHPETRRIVNIVAVAFLKLQQRFHLHFRGVPLVTNSGQTDRSPRSEGIITFRWDKKKTNFSQIS